MSRLIYLRQSAEPRNAIEKSEWFRECAVESGAKGATWLRYSVHPDDTDLTLVEGWDERPPFEGPPRWQVTRKEGTPNG